MLEYGHKQSCGARQGLLVGCEVPIGQKTKVNLLGY